MKLSFKTLKNTQFCIEEIDPHGMTVAKLKLLLSQRRESGVDEERAGDCKLIHSGKVLAEPEKLLTECGVQDGDFLVVMPPRKMMEKKVKKMESGLDPAASSRMSTADAEQPTPKLPSSSSTSLPSERVTGEPATSSSSTSPIRVNVDDQAGDASESMLLSGREYERCVQNMKEMGFEEAMVHRAMRAAYNNPDRAVEYLFHGIPDETVDASHAGQGHTVAARENEPPRDATTTNQPSTTEPFNMFSAPRTGTTRTASGSGRALDALRRLPHFNLLRRMVQQDPSQLQPLLGELRRVDPSILDLINQNQAEFIAMINEPVSDEDAERELMELASMMGTPGTDDASMLGVNDGTRPSSETPSGAVRIDVNADEMAQLQRLEELVGPMGVSHESCLEAWLSCDRNEEMAAAYIMDNLEEYTNSAQEGHNEEEQDETSNHDS